ncbi:peptide chain release factor N(5)-glutamine methyltransferase [Flavobacterium sp.]
MQIKSYKEIFKRELQSVYDGQEIDSFFYLVLEHLHGLKRIDLALDPETVMDGTHLRQWKAILADLKTQKPIQYILGETEFFGLRFLVNEHTLIPRPETEELVQWIINEEGKQNRQNNKITLLDIGTGSGCIAVSLAKSLTNAEVFAVDVSEKALVTAERNAEINGAKVNFINADILKISDLQQLTAYGFQTPASFDLIVSNPPYVRELEKTEIKPNVLEYEPHLALFVADDDALLFYRKIAQLATKNLALKGKLYFEINQYLGRETVQLLEDLGFKNVRLMKDIYGNDRMVSASYS